MHVLDGDDCLVGEGFEELNLRSGKGANLHTTRVKGSDQFSLLTKGDRQKTTPTAGNADLEFLPLTCVGNVQRAMLAQPTILGLVGTYFLSANGYGTQVGPRNHTRSITEAQH